MDLQSAVEGHRMNFLETKTTGIMADGGIAAQCDCESSGSVEEFQGTYLHDWLVPSAFG